MKCVSDMPEFKDKSHILTFDENDSVYKAVAEMAKRNFGAVLITKDGKLSGIFTERDLLRRVAAEGIDIKKSKLKSVMSQNVKTGKTTDQVADCLRRMSQGRFRHLPIVDDKGKLQGMLSQGDFVAYTLSEVIFRVSEAAQADIRAGKFTPFSIMLAIFVYTLALLFLISGIDFWFGEE